MHRMSRNKGMSTFLSHWKKICDAVVSSYTDNIFKSAESYFIADQALYIELKVKTISKLFHNAPSDAKILFDKESKGLA
jgi:hypothetical protein